MHDGPDLILALNLESIQKIGRFCDGFMESLKPLMKMSEAMKGINLPSLGLPIIRSFQPFQALQDTVSTSSTSR